MLGQGASLPLSYPNPPVQPSSDTLAFTFQGTHSSWVHLCLQFLSHPHLPCFPQLQGQAVQLRFHHLGPMVWWHHFQHLPCRFFFSQAAVRFHQQFNQGKTFTDLQSVGSYLSLIHQMHRCCPTNLPFCLTCWSTCNHLPTSRTPPKSHCTETAKTPPWPSICPLSHPQFSSLSNH